MFKETKIGTLAVAVIANIIRSIPFSGIPLIITVLLLFALSTIFMPTQYTKWAILSPQFTQFLFRAGDSMAKGSTPLLAYFVIYLGFLNIYNTEKDPISIRKAITFISPYFLIIGITWMLIIVLYYIIGIPIGPGVTPVL